MGIELTKRDLVILNRMSGRTSQPAAPLSSAGWQPHENDVAAVQDMMDRGILAKEPGFDSVQLTEDGAEALEDYRDREAARRAAESGW